MKRNLSVIALTTTMVLLQGCMTDALQTVQTYNNVRSGYQAYQGLTGMKDLQKAKPVLRDSDTLYVTVDLKAKENAEAMSRQAAEKICADFDRQFADYKAHDLTRGRELSCAFAGDVPAKAVVLNVRELVEESKLMRVIQSDTIKSESSWVARETGAILETQTNPGVKKYEELVGYVGQALSMQILKSVGPEQSDPDYPAWAQKVEAWSKARAQAAKS